MECNKDEALRAKQIAEKKMESNDFEGAQKIALKAQNLYPELENITQLLSICDVHCSAQKKIFGAEKDWYGILQVEKLADESAIRKQYRRLALYLHPDKNRFPGAEAAFKLICEANAILSDPTKKTLYDSKIRVAVRSSAPVNPPPHMKQNYQFNKQYGAQNNVSNGLSSQNQNRATQSSFSIRQDMFWTRCPFCSVKYNYERKFLNTALTCHRCLKNFTGYEISAQGVPVGSKLAPPTAHTVPLKPGANQYAGSKGKPVPNLGKFPLGVKKDLGSSSSVSQEASQWRASRKTVRMEPGVSKSNCVETAAKVTGDMKGEKVDNCNINSSHGQKGGTSNGDANKRETENLKNKREAETLKNKNKRGRKRVVESSSESSDTSSDSDLEDVTMKNGDLNSGPCQAHFLRRSSRKRQNVSYNEGNDDDDDDDGDEQKEDSKQENQNGHPTYGNQSKSESKENVHTGESMRDKDFNLDKEVKDTDAIVIESDSDQDSYSKENPEKNVCHAEDPEFNDFEKLRAENCFSVNQIWACYDSADGMPRFYAKVKKVCNSPFELSITWLEAESVDEIHEEWLEAELPVGCGSFTLGKTEKVSSRFMFSHLVHCEKGKKRVSFIIYPRKGEVWALYKDWELNWSSNPESHRDFKYEIVEVLSDFVAVDGAKVCYLDKVSGFLSLFQRSSRNETDSFLIGPNELYKFSHRISHYEMMGSEREGVPAGSFELDPASLPLNPDDLYYPGKATMGTGKKDLGVN